MGPASKLAARSGGPDSGVKEPRARISTTRFVTAPVELAKSTKPENDPQVAEKLTAVPTVEVIAIVVTGELMPVGTTDRSPVTLDNSENRNEKVVSMPIPTGVDDTPMIVTAPVAFRMVALAAPIEDPATSAAKASFLSNMRNPNVVVVNAAIRFTEELLMNQRNKLVKAYFMPDGIPTSESACFSVCRPGAV